MAAIEVSPIGGRFFSARNLSGVPRWIGGLHTEIQWIWVPAVAVWAVTRRTGSGE